MRNLLFCGYKWDKKFFFAFLITLVCALVCGIALYKPVTVNVYFIELGYTYVYRVFNFKNWTLFIAHFFSDLIFLYIIFLICYFTKLKYLSLILIFLRGLFFGIYSAILVCASAFGGVVVLIFVFVPATLISLALCYIVAEFSKVCNQNFVFGIPAALALIDGIVLLLLINVVFRIVIIIV